MGSDRLIRIVALISGRGSNLKAIIDAIASGQIDGRIVAVVSSSPDAPGLAFARESNIPAVVLEKRPYTEPYCPDLIVTAGFMYLLRGRFLERYHGKIMNIHPTLLPAFPGAHPHRDVLRYGAKISGCTVHFVDDGIDSGPIILQEAVPVLPDDDEETLAMRVLHVEHRLFPLAISLFAQGRLRIEGRKVRILG
jgi:phosphoribosylglycinamide formyltransferase-1